MSGTSLEKFPLFAPIVGTAVAVTLDVGYFYGVGINYFTFFSLSEHILFALEAIPIGIGLLLVAAVSETLAERTTRTKDKKISSVEAGHEYIGKSQHELQIELKRLKRERRFARLSFLGVTAIIIATMWVTGSQRTAVVSAVFVVATLLQWQNREAWYLQKPFVIGIAGIVAAGLVGEWLGSSFISQKNTRDVINLKSGLEVSTNVIRAGERGILSYTPSVKLVQFHVWDTIKSVSQSPPRNLFGSQ